MVILSTHLTSLPVLVHIFMHRPASCLVVAFVLDYLPQIM